MTHHTPLPLTVRRLLVLLAFVASTLCAAAQEKYYYTLTNGTQKWLVKPTGTTTPVETDVLVYGYRVTPVVGVGNDTSYLLRGGTTYLELDLTDAANPTVRYTNTFSPRCVWIRSSATTGDYRQEWNGKKYFLNASIAGGITVKSYDLDEPVNATTQWYDWDFGTAITEYVGTSARYHWIVWNGTEWTMSKHSYERPEQLVCNTSGCDPLQRYYAEHVGQYDNDTYKPTGTTAQFMPVEVVDHPIELLTSNYTEGLTTVKLGEYVGYGTGSVAVPMQYEDELPITFTYTDGTVQLRPAYIEYRETYELRGVAYNWVERQKEGGWGVASTTTRIFKPDYTTFDASALDGDGLPKVENSTIGGGDLVASVGFSINKAARRYLKVDSTKVDDVMTYRLVCFSRPPDGEATLEVTVVYKNGSSQTRPVTIKTTATTEVLPSEPKKAPMVKGAVFGGGRMADVDGSTYVSLHNADYLAEAYGGNDISGEVSGTGTVNIGTSHTVGTVGLRVGQAYGGGNGFYSYATSTTDEETGYLKSSTVGGVVKKLNATADAVATLNDGSTAPTIAKTVVNVGVGLPAGLALAAVRADSVFGGAKNAFVGTDGTNVKMDGGTVLALFGGNNYGGTLDASATATVTINGTDSKADAIDVVNDYVSGFGIDYGVRTLYGGGNKVATPSVALNIVGGMVDTAFVGGNSASVTTVATATVNCPAADVLDEDNNIVTARTKIFENEFFAKPIDQWVGGRGRYNVRCLFGGNNRADMNIVPSMTLTSGGIGTLYGGGNAGNMTASGTLSASEATLFEEIAAADACMTVNPSLGTRVAVDGADMQIDYLYGGCQLASVTNSTFVHLSNGQVGTLFGGCNISGNVGGGTYVVLSGEGTVTSRLFGGSNGYYHCNDKETPAAYLDQEGVSFLDNHPTSPRLFDPYDDYISTLIPTHNVTNVFIKGGTVGGNVYGGANLANVGDGTLRKGAVHLTMTGGTVVGDMYGGGNMASVYGLSYLSVSGGKIGRLFAGNDRVGHVENFGAYTRRDGTAEDFASSNGTVLNKQDDDGNWSAIYSAYVHLTGDPLIHHVYGGGNGDYDYDNLQLCDYTEPAQQSAYIDIYTSGGKLDTVFGGGNGVGVNSTVAVLLNTANTDGYYVGTIFGGNNKDNMDQCVPDVILTKGKVAEDIYGGSNQGRMGFAKEVTDRCGGTFNVASYVRVTSADVEVKNAIYGGCNMADVDGMAYVDIQGTADGGIGYVYGGNNIGGTVQKTRVDLSGGLVHHIYGGSNGYYDYAHLSGNDITVYDFGHSSTDDPIVQHLESETFVSATFVNIWGGTVDGDVFGGGRMGDCDSTHVVVDDRHCTDLPSAGATITGRVFGGGEGDHGSNDSDPGQIVRHFENVDGEWSLVPRHGNVQGWTDVRLVHATNVGSAKAYGGGLGGDVFNTSITMATSWDQPMEAIYGGCWGSDVLGSTNVSLGGSAATSGYTVRNVYGGNDRTGNVDRTNVTVTGGSYENIYGGGDGSDPYLTTPAPNNEQAVVNFLGGRVGNNIYGGGRMGTTMRTVKESVDGISKVKIDRQADGTGKIAFDIEHNVATAYADPTKYSYAIVNMRGGQVDGNIYAGAAGEAGGDPLFYGLKVLNMDGESRVGVSVYGGSENVADGYWNECLSDHRDDDGKPDQTTLRPSSILNITSGTIGNNVYGAGYLGHTYGSAYVNIGSDAIDSSVAYASYMPIIGSAYALFNPYYEGSGGLSPKLQPGYLRIHQSVYGGANWGTATGSSNFSTKGFSGGESRVRIDGNGYITWADDNDDVSIDIGKSVIGTGTSALSGDVLNRIDILNYGRPDPCHASRTLESVQRTDSLRLRNTAIRYTGANNAAVLYDNMSFSLNLTDTIVCVGYNLIDLDAQVMGVKFVYYYEDDNRTKVSRATLEALAIDPGAEDCSTDFCTNIKVIDPDIPSKKHTAWVVNRGYEVDFMYDNTIGGYFYAGIDGYGFLLAEDKVNACVIARPSTNTKNPNDGGFMSACKAQNLTPVNHGESWADASGGTADEYPYRNYSEQYRKWDLGKGIRRRSTNITAYKALTRSDDCRAVSVIPNSNETTNLAIAHAKLLLPPANLGHFYTISTTDGVNISSDNNSINLVDSMWHPTDWISMGNSWSDEGASDKWISIQSTTGNQGVYNILRDPNGTFALMMECGEHGFAGSMPTVTRPGTEIAYTIDDSYTVIPGASHVTQTGSFCSEVVGGSDIYDDVLPTMDLYMLYSPTITNTTLGTVTFTLTEHDADGNELEGEPIEVTVNISTIIEEFVDMECEVLAMYNEGQSNTFITPVVLPATLRHRSLYMTSVKWMPSDESGKEVKTEGGEDNGNFTLAYGSASIGNNNNVFTLGLKPSDDLSSDLSAVIGWHSKGDTLVNLYSAARSDQSTSEISIVGTDGYAEEHSLITEATPLGRKLGELDGRGMASLNVELGYNGNLVYPHVDGKGRVGKMIVGLNTYGDGNVADDLTGLFTLTIYVRVRDKGDTIYVASASSIPGFDDDGVRTTHQYHEPLPEEVSYFGKSPDFYVKDFEQAFKIYQQGDVVAIVGPVNINTEIKIVGNLYSNAHVIRYDGHHHQLPGDEFVPRGSLINISGADASLIAYGIDFDGSAFARKIKGLNTRGVNNISISTPTATDDVIYVLDKNGVMTKAIYSFDTINAAGPFISVGSGCMLTLDGGSTVRRNLNTTDPANEARLGAVNIATGGTLTLMNNVTVTENVNANTGDPCERPLTGAVYVNGGSVVLYEASDGTAIKIIDNYLMEPTSAPTFGGFYELEKEDDENVGLKFTAAAIASPQANLYLTRTEAALNDNMHDAISDLIALRVRPTDETLIGISKWFPGGTPAERDTIAIVRASEHGFINTDNFRADCSDNKIFYHTSVNSARIYLQRCATFGFQDVASAVKLRDGHTSQGQALEYKAEPNLSCPTGGDMVYARVKGGFFPYQYTWTNSATGDVITHTTGLQNKDIDKMINVESPAVPDYTEYFASIYDSLVTPRIDMAHTAINAKFKETVEVTDVAGCKVVKNIDVDIVKVTTGEITKVFEEADESPNNWSSTASVNTDKASAVTAKGTRRFRAITVTPLVWTRPMGTIRGLVKGDDNIYHIDDPDTDPVTTAKLTDLYLCEGDSLILAASSTPGNEFIMWDFDPFYNNPAPYIVPAVSDTVIAYFGPKDYWKDVVKSATLAGAEYDDHFDYDFANPPAAGYVTTYHGDAHIYNEDGLAWFISVVNGLNGAQARPFFFNRVFLHKKADGTDYDMRAHLWTPVGTRQHPFRGWFMGVRNDDTVFRATENVTIRNIIVNEPTTDYTGFFGFLDSATVRGIRLEGSLVRGSQYAGTLAASSTHSDILNCEVVGNADVRADNADDNDKPLTTILSAHYASGGMVALSQFDNFVKVTTRAKYIGDAVYSGGVVGHATSSVVKDAGTRNDNRMEGLYVGGLAGYLDGEAPVNAALFHAKSAGNPSVVENSYVHLTTGGRSARVGGLVGFARNTVLRNNYVYGDIQGRSMDGAVSGMSAGNVQSDENYYATAALSHADPSATAFDGKGNQVLTAEPVRGLDNLTRLLNRWVREQGEGYATWRSDLTGANGGYPVFGTPDMIPIYDSLTLTGCGEVEYGGVEYTANQTVVLHVVDSVLMVDSTLILRVDVTHAGRTRLADSATVGEDYTGHGFHVSAAESLLLRHTVDSLGSATLVLSDTIPVLGACDSIVTLTLTFTAPAAIERPQAPAPAVSVHPNPTTSTAHVECEGLQRVELFDNEGRTLDLFYADAPGHALVDLGRLASGIYYLRIHTAQAAPVIQKIIKK